MHMISDNYTAVFLRWVRFFVLCVQMNHKGFVYWV